MFDKSSIETGRSSRALAMPEKHFNRMADTHSRNRQRNTHDRVTDATRSATALQRNY